MHRSGVSNKEKNKAAAQSRAADRPETGTPTPVRMKALKGPPPGFEREFTPSKPKGQRTPPKAISV
eukprot:5159314-Pyramimonas_sp.AAC.1